MENHKHMDDRNHKKRANKKVIFVCTGNSCRSQMAEAIVNNRLHEKWIAYSGGTKPTGHVHPLVDPVLEEIGVKHEGRSKTVDEFYDVDFDLVVTVCDSAAEKCPLWLGKGKRAHMGFPDPAKAEGTPQEILQVFRQVRDGIAEKIPALLQLYE